MGLLNEALGLYKQVFSSSTDHDIQAQQLIQQKINQVNDGILPFEEKDEAEVSLKERVIPRGRPTWPQPPIIAIFLVKKSSLFTLYSYESAII